MNKDFKLLAIIPKEKCEKRFRKNLHINQIYQFYHDYYFKRNDSHQIDCIEHNISYPRDLFDINKRRSIVNDQEDKLRINISAVVGKNGSGKSALSELLLYSLFLLAHSLKFLDERQFLKVEKKKIDIKEKMRFEKDCTEIKSGLDVEIVYRLNDAITILRISNGRLEKITSKLNNNSCNLKRKPLPVKTRKDIDPFFYSMLVNYSLYGFNSNEIGEWIKAFFHKNDGYQMPIVINPYREKGKININQETYLTRSRLLANIMSIDGYDSINEKSKIDKVELYFDKDKDYKSSVNGQVRFTKKFINDFRSLILAPLFRKMFPEKKYPEAKTNINVQAELYLMQKLITIPRRYKNFSEFDYFIPDKNQNYYDLDKVQYEAYVNLLYQDRSHVTLKVRQTLNFLNKDLFEIDSWKFKSSFKLEKVIKKIEKLKENNLFTEVIDYVPPPFLISRIVFNDGSYFNSLSSGEKQKIYLLNSIVYHLKNIDSRHFSLNSSDNYKKNGSKDSISYKIANLLLDEIELYFHPEFQRNFIYDLLCLMEKAAFENLDCINILFLTHSPFILSDIPHQNILKLKGGKSQVYKAQDKVFGANIYTLLNDSFFMSNTIGKFAETKIIELISQLKDPDLIDLNEEKRDQIRMTISLIGEPILRDKLETLFLDKIGPRF